MKLKQEYKNLLLGALEKVIQFIISIIFISIISRYFEVEYYGIYQYAISYFFVATSLTWIFSSDILYSKIDKLGNISSNNINTIIVIRGICGISIFFLASFYAYFTVKNLDQLYFVLILLTGILYAEPLGVFRFLLETTGNYNITSIIRLAIGFFKLLTLYIITNLQFNNYVVLTILAIEPLLVLLISYYFYRIKYNYKIIFKDIQWNFAKDLIMSGIKYWPCLVAMSIFFKLDRIILQKNMSSEDFGGYSAAMSLLDQVTGVGIAAVGILGPVYFFKEGVTITHRKVLKLVLLFLMCGIFCSLTLYQITPNVIKIIFGNKFLDSVEIFKYVIFFILVIFPELILNSLLIKYKIYKLLSIKWLIVVVIEYFLLTNSYDWLRGSLSYLAGWVIALFISFLYYLLYFNNNKIISEEKFNVT